MTNTERIQVNNAELQECIELAESLPDAGGSAYRFFDMVSKTFFDSITDVPLNGGNY